MPDEKAPSSGAFLPLSLMYFLSGEPMHYLSGVDTPYPNIKRWLDTMKKLPNWDKVNEAFNGLREAVKGQPFVTLAS